MKVLGIESSCDETGIAIYDSENGLLAHALHSQIDLHAQYGGVVPELASRDHVKYLLPLLDEVLSQSSMTLQDLDAIAYTAGPGLIGALLSGACFAKSLAFSLKIPSLGVHHLEAHLLAAKLACPYLAFPFVVLLVSGGHTQLIEAVSLGEYRVLGDTLDDAVGEAFDKTAKLMGFPYPGGARLAKLADEAVVAQLRPYGDFPRPMLNKPGLDFSFSGLKTHALTNWNASDKSDETRARIAYAFQDAVVETLVSKAQRAMKTTEHLRLVVAGGVGANRALRQAIEKMMESLQGEVFFPSLEFCADNGAMVAFAGCLHRLNGCQDDSHEICVRARWPLTAKT
jgi:N6-L-threonylcarbamoyladenine synthase